MSVPATRRLRGLGGVLGALAIAAAAHATSVPAWVPLALVAAIAWRWSADRFDWPMPAPWLRRTLTLAAPIAVLASFRTLNGLEAGTAFLVVMGAIKLLETRAARDLTVLVFIAWFLLYAALLRDQQLLELPWVLVGALFATAALLRVHAGSAGESWRSLAGRTGALALQALPLALALFVLFPRLPGPFWGIAASSNARTGLSDEIMPGDVSDLSVSGEVAFRVRFDRDPPPPPQLYWRGPVLHDFDGTTWRRPRGEVLPDQPVVPLGPSVDYQITLEPHDRPWILALDLPGGWPDRLAFRAWDYTLISPRPITEVSSFRLRSYPDARAGDQLPASVRRRDLQLPPEGNPRARALGRELARRHGGDARAISNEMLRRFRTEPYVYTLEPPRLSGNIVDEFLFDSRRGFCEHYASAYTFVMRSAGVPSRIIAGYQGGEMNPLGGYLLVRQSDAHAWSEIWLEGEGWMRVDPTAAVAPERIERGLIGAVGADEPAPGRLRSESDLWLTATFAWDSINDWWNERIVRYSQARQFALLEKLGIDDPDWRALGLGLAGSLAAFFVGLTAWLAFRHRDPPRDWPARLHAEVARRLARRGLVPGPAEGPVHFLDRAAAHCPDIASDLRQIRALYVDLRYGPSPTAADLGRLKHLVNRLRT